MPFIDLLILQHLKDPTGFTEDEIKEEADTFMFAGHDTTGWALTFAIYMIGLHPDVQQKIQDEQESVFGGVYKDPQIEDLRQLSYLDCVIKECLRLYPSLPYIGRRVTEATEFLGYHIPKGVVIGPVTIALHQNPKVWPEPAKFKPERFFPENSVGRHPYAFLPFAAGQRNCIGQKYAMNELKTILTHVFQTYNVTSLVPRDKLRIESVLILKSCLPIPVKLEKRVR